MNRPNWYPRGSLPAPFSPVVVDDVTLAFPASVGTLMPPVADIPEEFGRHEGTVWNRFVSDRFFTGVTKVEAKPREGIDPTAAWRHVAAILGSWDPKHEYKEAAVAYLLSLWFESISWERKAAA